MLDDAFGHIPPRAHDTRSYGIRPDVFFRLDNSLLNDDGFPANTPDFVQHGARRFHFICYQYQSPWLVHDIVTSIRSASLTATVGLCDNIDKVLFHLCFQDWDDGWLLATEGTEHATRDNLQQFIVDTNKLIRRLPSIHDIRWFHNDMLTCGCFHDGDYELGTIDPCD